ncbi:hypothetical protein V6N12_074587 [Hibiscus sabdariffa]|uniref:Uncharacterized protein n=1 Tax=Hibiscus sabdariffa TaxID=183260 RepID=A0ABR2BZF2_9ROSI
MLAHWASLRVGDHSAVETSTSIPVGKPLTLGVASDSHIVAPGSNVPTQNSGLASPSPQAPDVAACDQHVESQSEMPEVTSSTHLYNSVTAETADMRTNASPVIPIDHVESETHTSLLEPVDSVTCDTLPDIPIVLPRDSSTNIHPMQTRGKAGIRKPKTFHRRSMSIKENTKRAIQVNMMFCKGVRNRISFTLNQNKFKEPHFFSQSRCLHELILEGWNMQRGL